MIGPRPIASIADIQAVVAALLDAWAERRCYQALGPMLNGPGALFHTDDWWAFRDGLRAVIASAGPVLTPDERDAIDELVAAVDIMRPSFDQGPQASHGDIRPG
jgi:hypothetical protein